MKTGLASFLALLLGACSTSTPEVWHPTDVAAGSAGIVGGAGGMTANNAGLGGEPPVSAGSGGEASDVSGGGVAALPCETTRDGTWIECHKEHAAVCFEGECLIEGSCVASGTSTADGCCSCEGGVSRCLNSPACPSTQLIGRRCRDQRDCNFPGATSDLECRSNFVPALQAELKVCARACSVQCPDDMECLHVPNEDGELVTGQVCMRLCETQADCAIEVGGASLGSQCIGFGLYMSPVVRSYCF